MTKKHYKQQAWNLSALLPGVSGAEVENGLKEFETAVLEIEAMRPLLTPEISKDDFQKLLKLKEEISFVSRRLGSYGHLRFAGDTQDQEALAFMGKMEQILTDGSNRILFVNLWWKSLEDTDAEKLIELSGDLRYYLEQQRSFKDHTLKESEEQIVNLKDVNGISALNTIYDMITNKYQFDFEVDGEKKQLTRDELAGFVRHPSPDVREAAYKELYRVYKDDSQVLSQIYIHTVRDWNSENLKLRNFASPISVRNLSNDIPDDVVDTMLKVCEEEAYIFQDYFKKKAGWLKSGEKLRRYDLYAPLKQHSDKKIDYSKAADMVLESFNEFSPEFAAKAKKVLDDEHIDSEVRKGKRGGAFCAGVFPGVSPWVLANYSGEPRQVATLAHELGHAVHALMAEDHSILTFHSCLPLAETASVFSEMLLTDRLLAEETNPEVVRDLLASAVDDAYATVLRQSYFVLFERDAHRMIAEGKTMNELNEHYLKTLRQQFGDSVEVSEDFMYEWICIPHIYHSPFYCYAYSFGLLLSLSLYQRYKEVGKEFVPSFLKILSYGGSAAPEHILKEAGIDMHDPEFWRNGFTAIKDMIARLD